MTPEEKMKIMAENGITSIEKPDQIVDVIKRPVKVATNLLDSSSNDINTVWAEKADYLNDENIGNGLENRPEFVKDSFGNIIYDEITYSLNIKPASTGEIGGVLLPNDGSVTADPVSGELHVDFATLITPATSTSLGGVRPQQGGILNYNEADGVLSANYNLPTASADVKGGIMVGKARTGIDTRYANRNLRIEDVTNLAVFSNILDGKVEYDTVGDAKHTLDYILHTIFGKIDQLALDVNTISVRLAKYFDKVLSNSGAILYGQGTFKGTGNGYAEVKFTKPLPNNHYHVAVCQLSSSGRVGELSATEYSVDGFKIYNTGISQVDVFVWMVIPSDITYAEALDVPDTNDVTTIIKNLPIKRGTARFNGTDGTIVSIENDIMYCSSRSANNITISSFPTDELHGVNGPAFKVAGVNHSNYVVMITPSINISGGSGQLDTSGVVGEIWVENKTSSTFTVKCSGANSTNILFDWVAIPYSVDASGEDAILDNSSINHDDLLFPIRCGSAISTNGSAIIDFGSRIYKNTSYIVFFQLTSNTGGHMGEYSVSEYDRTRSAFEITHTGEATNFTVDWIAIDIDN